MMLTSSASGPVYVAGLDRSGKTTMSAMLTSHPDLAIPGVGSNLWTYFYRRYGDLRRPQNLERCLHAMLQYKHVRYLDPDPDRIRRELLSGPITYARLLALPLIHYAERRRKPRWGAQTGLIERYAEPLLGAHPTLRVVHLIRDPRDRYAASLARWPGQRGRAGGAVARWRYSTALARRHQRAHPDRYHIVRFEDLVRAPEETVREVCDFLDLSYEPTMLDMAEAPTLVAKLGHAAPGTPGYTLLCAEHLDRDRASVRAGEQRFIERYAAGLMRIHGYEPAPAFVEPGLERLRFELVEQPSQLARLVSWRFVEELQQRWPRVVPRRPGQRMLVEPPDASGGPERPDDDPQRPASVRSGRS